MKNSLFAMPTCSPATSANANASASIRPDMRKFRALRVFALLFGLCGILSPASLLATATASGNSETAANSTVASRAARAARFPADPLESVMWVYMAERFFSDGEVIFDSRVSVVTPQYAEDQFYVPVTVDATALEADGHTVEQIVALADLNPIPHILTMEPHKASAFVGFRAKLQQSSPIRVGVKTSDGTWHVNGAWVDAAGGGCTAPAAAHGNPNWMRTLGKTRAIARRETDLLTRLSLRMRHPMDTGLAHGIPVFYMSDIKVKLEDGTALADVQLFEPVSENPTLTLKPKMAATDSTMKVFARDTEGNEFRFDLAVPAEISN